MERSTDKRDCGASYQGTFIDYERFGERGTYKHIDKNSTANHGFNLKIGDPKQLKFLRVVLIYLATLH